MKITRKELSCPCGCLENNISDNLLEALNELEKLVGIELRIISGHRCSVYNKLRGGYENSIHLKGKAVDIFCVSADIRYLLLLAIMNQHKFLNIGLNDNYIHLQLDDTPCITLIP